MESVFLGQQLDWKSEGLGTHQRAVQLHDYTGQNPITLKAMLAFVHCTYMLSSYKEGNGNNSRRSLLDNFCRQFTSIVAQYLVLF